MINITLMNVSGENGLRDREILTNGKTISGLDLLERCSNRGIKSEEEVAFKKTNSSARRRRRRPECQSINLF